MQSTRVVDVFDAVSVLFAARGIKIPSNQETKVQFEDLNARRWSLDHWRKFKNCTEWLAVATEEGDITEAQRTELALRIASAYLRCKVNLTSFSAVSAGKYDRSFGYEQSSFTTPTVTLNLGATNSVSFRPPTSFEISEVMVAEWLRPGAKKSDASNNTSDSKSIWRESRNWAAKLMLAGREALAPSTQLEAGDREASNQDLQQSAEGAQTQQTAQQPSQQAADSNQAQQFAEHFIMQLLAKSSAAGAATSTVLSHPAPILEKLNWESVKIWVASYRTFLSQTGRSDPLFHPSKSISYHVLRTAKAYWEIEQSKPLLAHIGKWEEAIAADPLTWLANFELVIKSKQGISTSSKIDLSLRIDRDGPLAEEFFEKFSDYITLSKAMISAERLIDNICKAISNVYPKTAERLRADMLRVQGSTDFTPEVCLRLALAELSTMRKHITDHNRSGDYNKSGSNNNNDQPNGQAFNNNNHRRNGDRRNPKGRGTGAKPGDTGVKPGDTGAKPGAAGSKPGYKRKVSDDKPQELTCWTCGEAGHTKRDCPKKPRLQMLRQEGSTCTEPIVKLEIGGVSWNAMVDTGANQESYCSRRFLDTMIKAGHKATPTSDRSVALADGKTLLTCTHVVSLECNLVLEGKPPRPLQLTLYQLSGIDYDIILGWRDTLKYGLLNVLQELYAQPTTVPRLASLKIGGSTSTEPLTSSSIEPTAAPKVSLEETDTGYVLKPPPIEDDGIETEEMYPGTPHGDSRFDQITWHGLEETMKTSVLLKLREFNTIFSETVRTTPCKMAAYKIIVDKTSEHWPQAARQMQQRERPQTPQNLEVINQRIKELLGLGVIRVSSEEYWAQIHVARKDGKKPRVCVDYRPLNKVSKLFQWPIPDIKQQLQKLRAQLYLMTIDLTDAYHQVSIDKDSVKWTAVRAGGIMFVWDRLGFGNSGAVAHFQFQMATVVLSGLVDRCCLVYLDDIVIFGETMAKFLSNVSEVLNRLRAFDLLVKASKIKCGTQLLFLGHIVSGMGLAMSDERKTALNKIQRPHTVQALQSFLGVANYFRDHVRGQSQLTRRLTAMIGPKNNSKRSIVTWTPETVKDFEDLKTAIVNAPVLQFLQPDPQALTGISCDASHYHWGFYLWQRFPNKNEAIILFGSGTFTGAQLNWPTGEKEMYSVVAAVVRIRFLIGTRFFIIETDHRNLQFWDKPSLSAKVERWKLYLTQFNCELRHIDGTKNVIADGLSRLMGIKEVHHSLMQSFHGGVAGHGGRDATLEKLRRAGHNWQGMVEEVTDFVGSCPICQCTRINNKRSINETFDSSADVEGDRVAMDALGPLDEDSEGYKYILAFTDEFSRFTVLFPLKTLEAEETADRIVEYVCEYGTPRCFKSDRGTEFNNRVVKLIITALGAQCKFVATGDSQANGIVERKLQGVRIHLGNLARERKGTPWSKLVKVAQRILNATVTDQGVAPADLKFGRKCALDANIFTPSGGGGSSIEEQVDLVRSNANNFANIIRKAIEDRRTKRVKVNTQPTTFQPGQWVWIEEDLRKGDPTHTKRIGPFQVVEQIGNDVSVRNNKYNRIRTVNVAACTLHKEGAISPERLQAELLEDDPNVRYYVEKIIDHLPKQKPKVQNTKLLVQWKGYEEPTWQSLAENPDLRSNVKFLEYTRENPTLSHLMTKGLVTGEQNAGGGGKK